MARLLGSIGVLCAALAAPLLIGCTGSTYSHEADPDRARAAYEAADIAERTGNIAEASARYQEAIKLNPSDAKAPAARAHMEWRSSRFREAALDYAEAEKRDRSNVEYVMAEIECRKAIGDESQTEELARRAVSIDPENPKALVYLGHHLATLSTKAGAWTEAREVLSKATRLAPAMPVPFVELGSLLTKMGDWPTAEAYLQSAWRMLHLGQRPLRQLESMALLDKRRAETAYSLAQCEAMLKRPDEARRWIQTFHQVDDRINLRGRLVAEATRTPPDTHAIAVLARMDIDTGGAEEAVKLVKAGLAKAPNEPELQHLRTVLAGTRSQE